MAENKRHSLHPLKMNKLKKKHDKREEELQPDLYNNYVKEKRKRPAITRLLYSALAVDGREAEMEKKISEWVTDSNSQKLKEDRGDDDDEKETYTGFMVIKKTFALHLIENHANEMEKYILHLKDEFEQEDTCYKRITIVAFNEENDRRY